jgi:hypothetical protein
MDQIRRRLLKTLGVACVGVAVLCAGAVPHSGASVAAATREAAAPERGRTAAKPFKPGARWYSKTSPWNTPIQAGARVDARSAEMVRTLIDATQDQGMTVAAGAWTVPVYRAPPGTARYDVRMTASWARGRTLFGVPIPANARPDSEEDGHMVVLDLERGCEYDFWVARKTSSGGWTAGTVARVPLNGSGVTTNGARAASFALGAGLIRPGELMRGKINHALVFAYPHVKRGTLVRPATSGSGPSSDPGAIPYGARVRLDPRLDLDSLSLKPWQRTIAKALQTYGMYLGDVGGTLSLYAQHTRTVNGQYPWGDKAFAYLPEELVGHFQVLELGPKAKQDHRMRPNRCGRFNW